MHLSTIKSALIVVALLLSASPSVAADPKPAASSATADTAKKSAKDSKPTTKKTTAAIKLVDINSAGKKELKTLPGIGEADADKIIAGRPYGSKAHLTTRGIVTREVYENLKRLVIAKQKPAAEPGRK